MTITDICSRADANKFNIVKLNELWEILKINKNRFTLTEFEFAAEHIGKYVEDIEDEMEVEDFKKKTSE